MTSDGLGLFIIRLPLSVWWNFFCLFLSLLFPRTLLEQVDHWQGFQALVSMIMSCTGTPGRYPVDETSSSLTLTFWYTLQVQQVQSEQSLKCGAKFQLVLHWLVQIWGFESYIGCLFQDEMTSLDAERQTLYLQIYRPVYFQLVDVLLQKACFPRDEDYATWSADDKEQFRTYRFN